MAISAGTFANAQPQPKFAPSARAYIVAQPKPVRVIKPVNPQGSAPPITGQLYPRGTKAGT